MAKVYEFKTSLAQSMDVENTQALNNYYARTLPGIASVSFQTDLALQRQGVDKIIQFDDGAVVRLDEKVDQYPQTGNIFIETCTNIMGPGRDTWLYTNQCDYVFYCFTSGEAYWLPMEPLKIAWETRFDEQGNHEWIGRYGLRKVRNKSYTGMGCPVPREVLAEAVWAVAEDHPPEKWDIIKEQRYAKSPELQNIFKHKDAI